MKWNIDRIKLIVWVLVVCFATAYGTFLSAGERTLVDGAVSTTRDKSGTIVAVKLNLRVEGGDVFNVVLDETGKKLGSEMDGKWVEVIGDVSIVGTETYLQVKSYKKVEEVFK